MDLSIWCNRAIRWGFYLLFILVPLILTPWNFELFEYNKMMVTYALTVIIMGAWLIKSVHEKELRIRRTPLDIPLWLFFGSQVISAIFSMDPHVSWFGYYSRFNGGVFSIASYILLYHAFISNILPSHPQTIQADSYKQKKKTQNVSLPLENSPLQSLLPYFRVMVITGAVVAAYGVAERLGIDKGLWVQDVQNRVFSTLGQPNWLAAYLVALMPVSIALAFSSLQRTTITVRKLVTPGLHWLWIGISVLFFLTLIFTRSRSGLFALAVADAIFWLLLFLTTLKKKTIRLPIIAIHLLFALVIFFNGANIPLIDRYFTLTGWQSMLTKQKVVVAPAPPTGTPVLETGGTESGTIRKYVWEASVFAWRSSVKTMLIGTGTETFAFAFYRFRPIGHNMTSEWDFLYNKAHNEYLNYLATTGALGLGAYLLFIGAFVVWFIKVLSSEFRVQGEKNLTQDSELRTINFALFAGWLSILVTNFFGFSVVIVQIFLFLFPALAILLATNENTLVSNYRLKIKPSWQPKWSFTGVSIVVLVLLFFLARFWQADFLFATGYHLSHSGLTPQAQPYLEQAIALNGDEPIYHDELASTLGSLAMSMLQAQNATGGADMVKRSLTESDTALSTSPDNVNFWKTRTKLYYSFSTYDPKLNDAAVQALERARQLSPNDPKIYYNLAILYGRAGKNDQAIELMKQSKDLKPNYHDAYYGLYVFYTELKQPQLARGILEEYLQKIDPTDHDFNDLLNK